MNGELNNRLKKLSKSLYLMFLFILLFNILNSIPLYYVAKLNSNVNTNVDVYKAYICQDSLCTNIEKETSFKLYSLDDVKSCFVQYNINNINDCLRGKGINNFNLDSNYKEFVVEVELDSKSPTTTTVIFDPDKASPFSIVYTNADASQYNINYINDVYWYLKGKGGSVTHTARAIDAKGKGLIIQNFKIANEVEINKPLFINLPISIDSKICSEIKKATKSYFPEEVKTISSQVSIKILDANNNVVYKNVKYLDISPDYCKSNLNFRWVPDRIGEHKVQIEAKIIDERVINSASSKLEQKVNVYSPNQRFCYTRLIDVSITGDKDWVIEEGESKTLHFKVLSAQNNGDGSLEYLGTNWYIYVNGKLVKNSYEPPKNGQYNDVLIDLTNYLKTGENSLKIVAQANNVECDYDNNEAETYLQNIRVIEEKDVNDDGVIDNPIQNNTNNTNINYAPYFIELSADKNEGEAPLKVKFNVKATDKESSNLNLKVYVRNESGTFKVINDNIKKDYPYSYEITFYSDSTVLFILSDGQHNTRSSLNVHIIERKINNAPEIEKFETKIINNSNNIKTLRASYIIKDKDNDPLDVLIKLLKDNEEIYKKEKSYLKNTVEGINGEFDINIFESGNYTIYFRISDGEKERFIIDNKEIILETERNNESNQDNQSNESINQAPNINNLDVNIDYNDIINDKVAVLVSFTLSDDNDSLMTSFYIYNVDNNKLIGKINKNYILNDGQYLGEEKFYLNNGSYKLVLKVNDGEYEIERSVNFKVILETERNNESNQDNQSNEGNETHAEEYSHEEESLESEVTDINVDFNKKLNEKDNIYSNYKEELNKLLYNTESLENKEKSLEKSVYEKNKIKKEVTPIDKIKNKEKKDKITKLLVATTLSLTLLLLSLLAFLFLV